MPRKKKEKTLEETTIEENSLPEELIINSFPTTLKVALDFDMRKLRSYIVQDKGRYYEGSNAIKVLLVTGRK